MSILSGKKVLLGVTGGIAAYKAPLIVRLLIKQGAEVKVVMTPSATDFVTPLTLSTLSKNPVLSSFTAEGDGDHPSWNNHVELALWSDLMLIAPATSNTISSMVNARCNNLLLACYLSAQCPVYIAPAMDLDMYKHPSTLQSFEKLKNFGLFLCINRYYKDTVGYPIELYNYPFDKYWEVVISEKSWNQDHIHFFLLKRTLGKKGNIQNELKKIKMITLEKIKEDQRIIRRMMPNFLYKFYKKVKFSILKR